MSKDSKYIAFICDSSSPKISGGGCCSEKGGKPLFELFSQLLEEMGLADEIEARSTGCLKNCLTGISVRIYPGNVQYGAVTPSDLEELIRTHFLEGQNLKRLQIQEQNRFMGF